MGAADVGDQRAPPSAVPPAEPPELEPLLPPDVVPGAPEPEPPEPLDPLAFPEPLEPELDPFPASESPSPGDASGPASMPLAPCELPGSDAPLPPEHPLDKARQARGIARRRASSAIMGVPPNQHTAAVE